MSYIFNSILFFTIPFIWILLTGSFFIKKLKKYEIGQNIREVGPKSHLEKEGIPTMGGILIISAILLPIILTNTWQLDFIVFILVLIATAIIGFSDDIIKIKKERSLGLTARQKIFLQVIIGLILGFYVYFYLPEARNIFIPISKTYVNFGIYVIPIIVMTYLSAVNAVNLTDGLDGLASSITFVVAITFFIIITVTTKSTTGFLALSIAGAALGFLWYNSKPASVFMGDVGSLSLGASLAVIFSYTGLELLLIVIGGIYVLEVLSVIVQVTYFKATGGKRILKMSPLHHHYELKGLNETKIVYRFTLVSIIFSIIGILITI
ncbi:MAG: phospho-N-acetylmuramoyl-pentapeptide-transferase [Bacillota bacterium]